MQLPNLIDNKTPVGSSENDNKVIKYNGKKPMFDFKPKNHLDIAEKLKFN